MVCSEIRVNGGCPSVGWRSLLDLVIRGLCVQCRLEQSVAAFCLVAAIW